MDISLHLPDINYSFPDQSCRKSCCTVLASLLLLRFINSMDSLSLGSPVRKNVASDGKKMLCPEAHAQRFTNSEPEDRDGNMFSSPSRKHGKMLKLRRVHNRPRSPKHKLINSKPQQPSTTSTASASQAKGCQRSSGSYQRGSKGPGESLAQALG